MVLTQVYGPALYSFIVENCWEHEVSSWALAGSSLQSPSPGELKHVCENRTVRWTLKLLTWKYRLYLCSNFRVVNELISSSWHCIKKCIMNNNNKIIILIIVIYTYKKILFTILSISYLYVYSFCLYKHPVS